ncbi:MAG: hypothetical protein E7049_02805 [Lentisphaerae bacterium]|jgi:hypothetical protein|nr:hypothetical protein [Lentisphaerota bacterium]
MKKLAIFAAVAALACPIFAQESVIPDIDENLDGDEVENVSAVPRKQYAQWPVFCAISEFPATPDIAGIRITIPFSTKQESVTGIDVGFWGRAQYFEGLQCNIFRNDVKDYGALFQVGCYNSIGHADLIGGQVGLWNESGAIRGFQVGLVNLTGEGQGFQVGIINRAEEFYGFQLGLINIIRDAELQFCPFVNVGF